MPYIRTNGLDVHYTTEGAGPPLVLLHGATSSAAEDWAASSGIADWTFTDHLRVFAFVSSAACSPALRTEVTGDRSARGRMWSAEAGESTHPQRVHSTGTPFRARYSVDPSLGKTLWASPWRPEARAHQTVLSFDSNRTYGLFCGEGAICGQ